MILGVRLWPLPLEVEETGGFFGEVSKRAPESVDSMSEVRLARRWKVVLVAELRSSETCCSSCSSWSGS